MVVRLKRLKTNFLKCYKIANELALKTEASGRVQISVLDGAMIWSK